MSKPTDATQFTLESAERIGRVVRAAELGSPQARPLSFDRVDVLKNAKVFRVCTFTGAWSINSAKTVTFINVTSTPNTVSAINLVCGLSPTGTCSVSVAKDGTAWYLVQPNLTQQPGYSSGGTQVLTVVDGSLKWTQPQTTSVLTSVALDSSGLKFITTSIKIFGTVSSSVTTIGTTACA